MVSRWVEGGRMPMVAVLAAVVLWGGSFTAMRIAVQALHPWTVMWIRMMTAALLLVPFAGRVFRLPYRAGDWKGLAVMALLQPCLYFFLESAALTWTTSSQAGVVAASVPLMVALGARVFLSEPLSLRVLGGLAASMLGVGLLTAAAGDGGSGQNPLLGNLLELAAMACAAANMVLIKRMARRYDPWALTGIQTVAGAVFFLPGLWFGLEAGGAAFTAEVVWSLAFLGGLVTLGAFGLYNWGISRMAAGRAAACINLVPVIAVVCGWGLLGEGLNGAQLAAAGLVLAGVWCSQVRSGRAAPDLSGPGRTRTAS